jgi:cation:H+ antiporter
VVTVAALRIGALDMAIGNLFGSNLFDIAIVAVDDLFLFKGPILSYVSPLHAVSVVSAIMMTGIAVIGLLYRPKTRVFQTVGWASLFLLSLYLLNSYVLYLYGE